MAAPPPGFEAMAPSHPPSLAFDNIDTEEELLLESTWCFWNDKYVGPILTDVEYEASLHKLCTFHTVQQFWQCFNNLPAVGQLRPKSSFHVMKEGISPLWEDPKNANGGFWAVRVRKDDTSHVWKELVLAIIGEQFEPAISPGDDICGLTVSIRQFDDIFRLWNTNSASKTQQLLSRMRELLPDVELKGPFYKENREHTAFSQDLHAKRVDNH
eukprot:TRINITY_DN625_c0_g1_i3.p1 TRINITY_DN625_c0_g1~~TRINITY_DN625_c0_g1_i3.p1  ORF type:complete len:213 (-),score=44.26 TRINITY_DN625_c0_g1_i3:243-881(-)